MAKRESVAWDLTWCPPAKRALLRDPISRDRVSSFCEGIQTTVREKGGIVYYYWNDPKYHEATMRCEWDIQSIIERKALRLGIIIKITPEKLADFFFYITTYQVYKDREQSFSQLTQASINEGMAAIDDVMAESLRRTKENALHRYYAVRYIEVPPNADCPNYLYSEDGSLIICPTVTLVENRRVTKRVSAILIAVEAVSRDSARDHGITKAAIFCALGTLSYQAPLRESILNWPKSRVALECLETLPPPPISLLYPKCASGKQPLIDGSANEALTLLMILWKAYALLQQKKQKKFLDALLAYQAGMEVSSSQPTLAVVSFTAVLSSFKISKGQKCQGQLECSVCGKIKLQHNHKSESDLIVEQIVKRLSITSASSKERLSELIRRVYAEQRSAYVHDAVLRQGEQNRGNALLLPGAKLTATDVHMHRLDLYSLAHITRKMLLADLVDSSGIPLPSALHAELFDGKMFVDSNMEVSFALGAWRSIELRTK